MKNRSFLGITVVAVMVLGLALTGCQNPASGGTYLDGTLANIGKNVLADQGDVFNDFNDNTTTALRYTHYNSDGTFITYAKLNAAALASAYSWDQANFADGTPTPVASGTYTYNTAQQKITYRVLKQYPATSNGMDYYLGRFTAAGVDTVLARLAEINNAKDENNLVDRVASGNAIRDYLLANPAKYLSLVQQGYRIKEGDFNLGPDASRTEAYILDNTAYSTIQSYLIDYYAVENYGHQPIDFRFNGTSKTQVAASPIIPQ
ncbi:hypothetical protein AGMMS49546_16800 [Spirochaetia bacterium]|nr:hypothetical protein AGMMS49546_16800 [Spirochaetia bacterium]